MANVVNANSINRRLDQLGWPFQMADVAGFLANQNISATEFVAYLDACLKTGDGVDDAAIPGCSPASGARISTALKNKGLMF